MAWRWRTLSDEDGLLDNLNRAMKSLEHELKNQGKYITFTANDATPSVAGGWLFETANTAPTTVTTFDGGVEGQEVVVKINDAFTTLDFSASSLVGNGGVDLACQSGDLVRAVRWGTTWLCAVSGLSVPIPGTYTPTLTNVANLDGSTAYSCQYVRIGSFVHVTGRVDVNPTAPAAATRLGISLPIASDLVATGQLAGTAFSSAIAGQGAAVIADATNNRAQMEWVSGDVTNQDMHFTFSYRVL